MVLGERESRSSQKNVALVVSGGGLVVAFDDHLVLENGLESTGHAESLLAPPLRVVGVPLDIGADDALVAARSHDDMAKPR